MAVDPTIVDLVMGDDYDNPRDERDRDTDPSFSKSSTVLIDDQHPFELDAYISQYSGRMAIQHLHHIVSHCPQLAGQAYYRLIKLYRTQTRDTVGYVAAVEAYSALDASQRLESVQLDVAWVDEMEVKNAREKNKLEAELKAYTTNMIKESIRLAHRELASFHHETGQLGDALRHYAKCREFCSTSQHLLEMCIQVLEVLIEQRSYSHISTYVYKAEAALDQAGASTSGPPRRTPAATPAAPGLASASTTDAARERIQSKLELASAISHLGQHSYEKAARAFLKIKSIKALDDWCGKMIAPSDIAVFGVLCALTSLPRSAIQAAVIESDTFSMFIEQERYVRDILDAYMTSKFKEVLTILDRHSTKHALSPFLASHLQSLTAQIRSRALVLYFTPFQSVKLETMSLAFGVDIKELETDVIKLIKEGKVKARIDSKNKILIARAADHGNRADVYKKVLQAGRDMQATNRKLLIRMSLIQSDLLVKAPKSGDRQPTSLMADIYE